MVDTTYYIMTLGRINQPTLNAMPNYLRKHVRLVVQEHEKNLHSTDVKKLVLPKDINRINTTREYLFKHTDTEHMFLMDDDLSFYRRKSDTDWHLCKCSEMDMNYMFRILNEWLEDYAHVAVSQREGNNRVEVPYTFCSRAIRCVGYRTAVVSKLENISRLQYMSDFDVTLRLLRQGYANKITYQHAQNHGGSNAPGGCSLTRTKKGLSLAAEGLHSYHRDYVKLVEKETKGAWGGGIRKDVIVQWKKAYLDGINELLK